MLNYKDFLSLMGVFDYDAFTAKTFMPCSKYLFYQSCGLFLVAEKLGIENPDEWIRDLLIENTNPITQETVKYMGCGNCGGGEIK